MNEHASMLGRNSYFPNPCKYSCSLIIIIIIILITIIIIIIIIIINIIIYCIILKWIRRWKPKKYPIKLIRYFYLLKVNLQSVQ
jgi:hypothetical protein